MYSVMRHRHGCVIVYNGSIVSKGWNHTGDSPKNNWSFHAEVDALRRLKKQNCKGFLSKCDLYVVRVRYKNCIAGGLMNSKPCQGCERILSSFGLRAVYYST